MGSPSSLALQSSLYFIVRIISNDKETLKENFNVLSLLGNVNQNDLEISTHKIKNG